MNVDCFDIPNIDTGSFYYLGDEGGMPLSQQRFGSKEKAKKHFEKCTRKPAYKVFIWEHLVKATGEVLR
jgi:hypothetical protein